MSPNTLTVEERLNDALCNLDDKSRSDRVARIIWLAEHESLPGVIMGRAETLHILREAREVFVGGHFAAALVLAIAVVEHSLMEELQLRGLVKGHPTLSKLLEDAEKCALFPPEWFGPIKRLTQLRNPFTHLKDSKHEHGLGRRVILEKLPPAVLLENDAKEAVRWMYMVFRATLRELA
jgi:hypothetical protein